QLQASHMHGLVPLFQPQKKLIRRAEWFQRRTPYIRMEIPASVPARLIFIVKGWACNPPIPRQRQKSTQVMPSLGCQTALVIAPQFGQIQGKGFRLGYRAQDPELPARRIP